MTGRDASSDVAGTSAGSRRITRRVRRRDLVRLLESRTPGPECAELAEVLAAATAPAAPHELTGEQAAVAGFVAARNATDSATTRRPRVPIPTLAATSTMTKIAAVVAVLSFGGVAVAAHEGALPGAVQDVAHQLLGGAGVPAKSDHANAPDTSATPAGPVGPDATGPAVLGLCRAFLAGEKEDHGEALDSTALAALATAAGGAEKVEAYCDEILDDEGSDGPQGTPSAPVDPPVSGPPDEPGNPSPDAPAEATDHPTGRPTDGPGKTPTQSQQH